MKKRNAKLKYSDEPIGEVEIVPDFLPDPKSLVLKEDTVKVTLSLTKESVDFFKQAARLHHTQYQKMIRSLLNQYVQRYKKPGSHK